MDELNIKMNESLIRDGDAWLHFADPDRIIVAETLADVLTALREVERLTQINGWYAAGFLSYEAAPAFDSAFQTRSSLHSTETNEFPYLWFGLYPKPRTIALPEPARPQKPLNWLASTDPDTYNSAIASIKDHIAEGRTYQVNYTMRLQADFTGNAWEFFLELAQSQNNHGAYIQTERHVICSASPELFFQLDGTTITCRPMKGTAKRGRTTREDRAQSEWLKHSIKNRAENVMIVDMIRNDLGRIAKVGSVSVSRLFEIERYPTLWQMTSTIDARTEALLPEIFGALFPSASITGAPKISTMNIIAELENSPRKMYTGSIGYILPGRKAKFNVAIRTAVIDRARQIAEYGIGGGIVWDSTSTDEYAEARLKAQVLIQQHPVFALLETLLWTREKGYFLRDQHIARMLDSANYFDIPASAEKLQTYLNQICEHFIRPQRVRVTLDQSGKLDFEAKPFDLTESDALLKASIAKEPIDSSNFFLFHKTTQRDVYESAREGFEEFDDVLLYNELSELTEFTIGNLVVELNGRLLTPFVSSGVLPGTFRAHLLETGQIAEGTIKLEQLGNCTKLFRVNSIRKWQQVEIQERAAEPTS